MDLTRPSNPTDYHAAAGVVSGTAGDAQAVHYVRQTRSIVMQDTDPAGAVLFRFPIDVNMDDASTSMATNYERYAIKDLQLDIQSTSPLGSSSGGYQVCMIPDPANVNFNQENVGPDPQNLEKAVRQSGSVLVRPRDAIIQDYTCVGTLYTKQAGDPRGYSYGEIVAVVRDSPSAGDIIRATITLTCSVHFYRTAMQDASTTAQLTVLPQQTTIEGHSLALELPPAVYADTIFVRSHTPYKIQLHYKSGNHIRTKLITFSVLKMRRDDLATGPHTFKNPLDKLVPDGSFHHAEILSHHSNSPLTIRFNVDLARQVMF